MVVVLSTAVYINTLKYFALINSSTILLLLFSGINNPLYIILSKFYWYDIIHQMQWLRFYFKDSFISTTYISSDMVIEMIFEISFNLQITKRIHPA